MLKKRITEKDIEKVDDYSIFRNYFGEFSMNKSYPSIFRKDEKPSTGFYINKEGRIIYHDFATSERFGAIQFVSKLYGMQYGKAIEKIAQDFGILKGGTEGVKKIYAHKKLIKKKKFIQVKSKDWDKESLIFWRRYGITQEELVRNGVHPVLSFAVNGYEIKAAPDQPRYAYLVKDLDENEYVKIYSPFDKEYKWVSSVPLTLPFGLYDLPFKSDTLIVTKGIKEKILFEKFGLECIATQNESKDCLEEDVIEMLSSHYAHIYVAYDVDETGKKASSYYNQYGWKWLNIPNIYLKKYGMKDFADLVYGKGLDIMRKFLVFKEVI